MEKAQNIQIPLTSGIDIKSSDMLVNVNRPLFHHNRQKFQGNYLPSSLRFEHDGWAAGDDVYQFNITEAFVQAGRFKVTKNNINKNPSYMLSIQDADNKQIGRLVYTSANKVLESSTPVDITGTVNPIITGTINGKQFELNVDSKTCDVSVNKNNTAIGIRLLANSVSSSYVMDVQLQDTSATVELTIPNIAFPSEQILNGNYLLGQFVMYKDNVATWQGDAYIFNIKYTDNGLKLDVLYNNTPILSDIPVRLIDNVAHVSFTMPMTFVDTPQITLNEFIPFFTGVTAESTSKSIRSVATTDLSFNTWSYTIEDRGNKGGYNRDKLYKNIVPGHDDYNKQTIEQIVPIWFGVSARPAITTNISGNVVTAAGTVIKTVTAEAVIEVVATADVQEYSNIVSKPDINVWEGTIDNADKYAVHASNVDITVHYTGYSNTNDPNTARRGSFHFTLTNRWSNITYANIMKMIRVSDTATVTINSVSMTVNYDIDLTTSKFYAGSNIRVSIIDNSVKITPPANIKGQRQMTGDADYMSRLQATGDTVAFWGVCCDGKIASSVFIKSDKLLNNSIDNSSFGIVKADIVNPESFVDVSDLFEHKIVSALCTETLNITVCLVSADELQYMFYCDMLTVTIPVDENTPPPKTYYMPGHIVAGDILKVNDTTGKLNSMIIQRNYATTDMNVYYGLTLYIKGAVAKTKDNRPFNYITVIQPSFNINTLMGGNKYTIADVPSFIDKYTYIVGGVAGWVDISKDSKLDSEYLVDYAQAVTIRSADVTVQTHYNLDGAALQFDDDIHIGDTPVHISTRLQDEYDIQNVQDIQYMQVAFTANVPYNTVLNVPQLSFSTYTLQSLENNIATLITTDNKYKCVIDYDTRQVILYVNKSDKWGVPQECDETWHDDGVDIVSEYIRSMQLVLNAVYNTYNVTVKSITDTAMSVVIGNEEATIDLNKLLYSKHKSNMSFMYTRVDNSKLEQTQFADMMSDDEFQFLRQQWDTTNDTENFWWIDEAHILALTKSNFILREKTDVLHDWNGDVYRDVHVVKRISILQSNVSRFLCTSAYKNQRARLVTLRTDTNTVIINMYDALDNFSMRTIHVPIVKRNLGETLCPDNKRMYTYSELSVANVVSKAEITATCIDKLLILGVHFDNNMNQWTLVIDLNKYTLSYVIQGYGFVGVNGSLTGGEIPTKYFDVTRGFTGAVQPLKVLDGTSKDISNIRELWEVQSRVVGSDIQQWYIDKNIPSIVSHVIYDNGVFKPAILPLNNNYAIDYGSPSYAATIFSDYSFKIRALRDLLPEASGVWTAILVLWAYPMLYFLDPRISVANYLQQTLGQAAYVHYNTGNIKQFVEQTNKTTTYNYSSEELRDILKENNNDTAVSSAEITFDRQTVKQSQKNNDPYSALFTMFAAALVSALDWGQDKLRVNAQQNQAAMTDKGKKYADNFLHNMNSLMAADMNIQSISPALTSEVTAIKTLDMFYSTSNKQKIYAGAGFVNHNFVAQCVAQSVTSTSSEFSQQRLLYIVDALTTIPLQQLNKALVSARNAIKTLIDSQAGPCFTFGGIAGAGLTPSYFVVLGLMIGWIAADIAVNITAIGLEVLPRLLQALGGGKLNSSIAARQSKHKYDIESKHNYGSRTECFMWPSFGIEYPQTITDEAVNVSILNKSWLLSMPNSSPRNIIDNRQPAHTTAIPSSAVTQNFDGFVDYHIAMVNGVHNKVTLPNDMAFVIGNESFLPDIQFKNENIEVTEPVFAPATFNDFLIDKQWQLGRTASMGLTTWLSCKDTKIIDGEASNIVISDGFCGVAAPYTAIEIKKGIHKNYLRPWAITPNALALNNTGLNCCFEEKAYHAFDGYGYRIINWLGSSGMNKERMTFLYAFLANDRLKRSNKMPKNMYIGNFTSQPVMAINSDYNDKIFSLVTIPGANIGLETGTIGEDKDIIRTALPIFSEFVNTLPAAVKTISTQVLSIIDGVTGLVTENRDLQSAYKAPTSVDFTIGKIKYRYTRDYICSLKNDTGITIVEDLVPCLGLTFIGSTPYEAYLYSHATRQYYAYTGGTSLKAVDTLERFNDIVNGRYDFINQEVAMPCVATFNRLDARVKDDNDITDNVMVLRVKGESFIGEVPPPLDTIYNTRSWFRTLSLPCGLTYQGPNRCIINRFVFNDYMHDQITSNYGKWQRVPRELYHPFRKYKAKYQHVNEYIGDDVEVNGWTHNPFLLVTAPLGIANEIDCKYEWEITFCWPVEMDKLYSIDSYAVVNIQAETMTPGGKVIADRPTHVFLTKELFTRTGNYGYYSFRYQSNCGAGNRERLHIWSDQYICISALQVSVAQVTEKRTEILTQQQDILTLKEL